MTTESNERPTVIGIYGISGSGKTYMLEYLKKELGQAAFAYYDGSSVLAELLPRGLDDFKQLSADKQSQYRERAIKLIGEECANNGKVGVVAGHFMFWETEDDGKGQTIGTEADWATYTHILYLRVDAEVIAKRRKDDARKRRTDTSIAHLAKWQDEDASQLRDICRQKRILFSVVSERPGSQAMLGKVTAMVRDFQHHNEVRNTVAAQAIIDYLIADHPKMESVLVLDADRTLAPQDTGALFWKAVRAKKGREGGNPLKTLFTGAGYSYFSFRQATLLYEEEADHFESICVEVASQVQMYPEFVELLKEAKKRDHVGVIVLTCGLRSVWEMVLKREVMPNVRMVAGERLSDGFVVTGTLKGTLVDKLLARRLRVFAFGDSPLDMEMLKKADHAFIVVGKEAERSKSMEDSLGQAVEDGLYAEQIILPQSETPRLDLTRLPKFELGKMEVNWILRHHEPYLHATDRNAAKLLMSPMRDARSGGHDLRKAHERVGFYLATELLAYVLGVEQQPIPHVQGKIADGYRLRAESQTLIVPLMRGGEPMAFGVSAAMKTASFVHAKEPEDLEAEHMIGKRNIILVDSVVNSGKSVVEFVRHVRKTHPHIQIIVVAGVVQAGAVLSEASFGSLLKKDKKLSLIALRLSENKYTGRGNTDTGHRLFNTTHLD
ncbi:uracil phosphoribosyltransferase [Trematosphaeria pertusa]|uniref:Uracil phosphoribosyltransferase n=1 Tax=Trematosphaeria pertusa TaxID=390896 RepID=A0A6A6IH46_9PLEO|nr:uracil phosphoribosyltransferase [Trematosphaeria pertusa]KAF2249736.1 uracil phosphoribosyltransferase [Trematosphaeria pertusa]